MWQRTGTGVMQRTYSALHMDVCVMQMAYGMIAIKVGGFGGGPSFQPRSLKRCCQQHMSSKPALGSARDALSMKGQVFGGR